MRVLKFGGTSVATPDRIVRVADIVRAARKDERVAVVVSALGGVTNALGEAAEAGRRQVEDAEAMVADLEKRHLDAVRAVANPRELMELESRIRSILGGLLDLLRGVRVVGEVSQRTLDRILGCGELLSAPIVAAALRRARVDATSVDARRLIVTDAAHGRARPDETATQSRIRKWFDRHDTVPVITGFVSATADGETTTLGRGGSDLTASIVAVATGASAVELWTDVDGVMSADPRLVEAARTIDRLRYDELMELSHFGAEVVYPPSVHPVRSAGIPLWIKNTLRPESAGTLVTDGLDRTASDDRPVRGITSIHQVAMARLEGDGMVGVPGVAMRLFGALARRGVSVILITQGSSEHSICFAVAPEDLEASRQAVQEEFEIDRRAGDIDGLNVEEDVAVVAVVGAAMCQRPGIAGRLFSILGERGINVRAIAQGSSELNISLVVKKEDETQAIRAIHATFFERSAPTASVFLAGVGAVGSALLDQLAKQGPEIEDLTDWRLRLDGVANSRGTLLAASGMDPLAAAERLRTERSNRGPGDLIEAALASSARLRVFVDCTASDGMAAGFGRLLSGGVTVVSANKKPLTGGLEVYRDLRRLAADGGGGLYHEATVGAGLPVVRTLADLLATGDQLVRIEGVLSGTASFLAGELARGVSFSRAVESARELGYSEPDPRDDLTGEDTARKLLILARMAGAPIERGDLHVKPWIPTEPWGAMTVEKFTRRLPNLDTEFAERQRTAAEAGRRLAYLALWDESMARVALVEIGADHPCFDLDPGENLIAFHTRRYAETPLVVRGPGAGPQVTAAGVFADIVRALAERGHQS